MLSWNTLIIIGYKTRNYKQLQQVQNTVYKIQKLVTIIYILIGKQYIEKKYK